MEFWKDVFDLKFNSGSFKYPNLSYLVKACFTLSHGNADVERGFSESGYILDDGKTFMTVELLNGILNTRNGMRNCNQGPHTFVINACLLKMARSAGCSYKIECAEKKKAREAKIKGQKDTKKRKLEQENKKKEVLTKKMKLEGYEKELKSLMKELTNKRKAEEEIFDLGKALSGKNINDVQVAQSILQGVDVVKAEKDELTVKVEKLQKKIDNLKDDLLKQVL